MVVSIDTFCNLWESEFFKARTFEEKTYAVRTITSAYFNDGAPELENDTRNTSIRMEIEALGHSNSQEFSDLLRQAFLRRRDFWPGGAEPKGGTPDAREAAAKARDGNREMVDEVGREAGVDARIECLKRLIERRLDKEKSGSSARPHALAFWPS